jgi:hypothetical protein
VAVKILIAKIPPRRQKCKILIFILHYTLGEKLAVFIKFKNEILRPYGLRMTGKG